MKKVLCILLTLLMFCVYGAAEEQNISIDYHGEQCAVVFLPDLTGQNGEWVLERDGGDIIQARMETVPVGNPADPDDKRCVYRLQMDGITPGFCYVTANLMNGEEQSWQYNFMVEVDDGLNVLIRYADLFPWQGDISRVNVNYGISKRFTEKQIAAAVDVILRKFKEFSGCVLYSISYGSDDLSDEYFTEYSVRYGLKDHLGRDYVDGICFRSSFRTGMADDGLTGFESNQIESGYEWILLLTEDGEWEYVTSGY